MDGVTAGELVVFLVTRRLTLRISQREVARRMGSTQSVLSDVEAGKTQHPTFWYLSRWAAALGVSVGLAVEVVGDPFEDVPRSVLDRLAGLEEAVARLQHREADIDDALLAAAPGRLADQR